MLKVFMHLNPKGKNYNLNLNKYNQKTKTCGYRTINCAIKKTENDGSIENRITWKRKQVQNKKRTWEETNIRDARQKIHTSTRENIFDKWLSFKQKIQNVVIKYVSKCFYKLGVNSSLEKRVTSLYHTFGAVKIKRTSTGCPQAPHICQILTLAKKASEIYPGRPVLNFISRLIQ